MNPQSVILRSSTRLLLPLLLLFAFFLLLRGHNAPGGGFVGGLVAAAAIALYALAYSVAAAQQLLRVDLRVLMGTGLLCALVAALWGLFASTPLLTGIWYSQALPVVGKVGTPLLFDLGVMLVVLGIVLQILFALMTAANVTLQPVPVRSDEPLAPQQTEWR